MLLVHPRWRVTTSRTRQCVGLLFSVAAAWLAAAADHPPLADLPGIISSADLESGVVPLKAADLEFYMKIQRATLERYQHPPASDLTDMAEAKRLIQRQLAAQLKVVADMKAGNTQAAAADMDKLTPAEAATLGRGTALSHGRVDELVAAEAGMPVNQWDKLSSEVQRAAGLDGNTGYGSAGTGMSSKLTPDQQARAQAISHARASNRSLVAPSVPELKRIKAAIDPIVVDRAQHAGP
jgi:hypothetical protein